ncbi:hypothetical protein RV13_GL002533 [Enterococcus raffinosus]|nr:hypothetical protein RV13_GL002533 [Enterococcus raffinosus]
MCQKCSASGNEKEVQKNCFSNLMNFRLVSEEAASGTPFMHV